jgi:cytochrome c-type protein NapC
VAETDLNESKKAGKMILKPEKKSKDEDEDDEEEE